MKDIDVSHRKDFFLILAHHGFEPVLIAASLQHLANATRPYFYEFGGTEKELILPVPAGRTIDEAFQELLVIGQEFDWKIFQQIN